MHNEKGGGEACFESVILDREFYSDGISVDWSQEEVWLNAAECRSVCYPDIQCFMTNIGMTTTSKPRGCCALRSWNVIKLGSALVHLVPVSLLLLLPRDLKSFQRIWPNAKIQFTAHPWSLPGKPGDIEWPLIDLGMTFDKLKQFWMALCHKPKTNHRHLTETLTLCITLGILTLSVWSTEFSADVVHLWPTGT